KQASFVNTIATVCKILPLVVFIIVMVVAFNFDKFSFDFWGHSTLNGETNLGSLPSQIKSTMLVTLWAFIGIEGAVVLSGRAKSPNDVGKATILGFAGGLLVFVLLSVLPFGAMSQAELAAVKNPSTAGVLEHIVGPWGAWLMNIGLIIAILASWLAWTMITAEVPYAAAKDGTFPKIFARENANGSPSVSLWITSLLMQLAMLMVYFSNDAWNTMLSITGVMVLPPYLASTAYLWKISKDGELKKDTKFVNPKTALACAVLGSIFSVWLIYAAGLKYLLLSIIFLAIGIPFFVKARKEHSQKIFEKIERIAASIIAAIAVVAVALLATGKLKLGSDSASSAPASQSSAKKIDAKKDVAPLTKRHGENVIILEEITDIEETLY
ncbi:MAG: amino acid permease, partial [Opitutales bacterium]|nr:amino acid permease [Opitutales bacterium]